MSNKKADEPVPGIKKSIRIGVREYTSGAMLLLARLMVISDGGIILLTPWGRRAGLFLSEFELTGGGTLPVRDTTIRVGQSGVAKCHYHKSGFTSVQSQGSDDRISIHLPALPGLNRQQFAHIHTGFPGMLPLAKPFRTGDIVYIMDVPGMKTLSLHVAVYNRQLVPEAARCRVIEDSPVSFTSGDGGAFIVDISSTGLELILGFFFRVSGQVVPNSPEFSMNMYHVSNGEFGGAVGVQTEREFARFGILDRVPDLAAIHDRGALDPISTMYPTV